MSLPPPKRKRTSSLPDLDPSAVVKKDTLVRSEHMYLEDGNIAVVAENVVFRVHKSQLGRNSEVFGGMFACIDQSTNQVGESFDSCPVVRLSDKSNDVRVLLEALYASTQSDADEVGLAITVLQMSMKYLIEPLRISAFKTLQKHYPDALKNWTSHDDLSTHSHSYRVIQDLNIGLLLPAAYYRLCCSDIDRVMTNGLPLPVLERYCRGKEQLSVRLSRFIDKEIVNHGTYCKRACCEAWKPLEKYAHDILRRPSFIQAPDPLVNLLLLDHDEYVSAMCKECRTKLKGAIDKERETIWASLPQTFGLGTWAELRTNV